MSGKDTGINEVIFQRNSNYLIRTVEVILLFLNG